MDTKGLQKEFIDWCKSNKKQPKSKEETQQLFVTFMKEKHPEEYKAAMESQQKQAQKALHGAKLQYIRSLKNQCPEGEELYYYKKGGSVGCGCKKKEDGGEIKESKDSVVSKFKARKADTGTKLAKIADATGSQGGFRKAREDSEKLKKKSFEDKWKKGQVVVGKDLGRGVNPNRKSQDEHGMPDKNFNKGIYKNCGGSKLKLQKKGGEVCPKCGKVHAAGTGCTVAKFKSYRQGGK